MKVIHIESGLGNQMLSYCEFLAMRKVCPDEEYYLETLTYEFAEVERVFCQWCMDYKDILYLLKLWPVVVHCKKRRD